MKMSFEEFTGVNHIKHCKEQVSSLLEGIAMSVYFHEDKKDIDEMEKYLSEQARSILDRYKYADSREKIMLGLEALLHKAEMAGRYERNFADDSEE